MAPSSARHELPQHGLDFRSAFDRALLAILELDPSFVWHYTPKHGSWLNMAESELGVLATQCLDRRIPNKPALVKEVAAWQDKRNKHHTKADWQFTTADARVKLKKLYPRFE